MICDIKRQTYESRGNADFKSANLFFLGVSQIRRFASPNKSANLRFLEETQIRRFADWLGQICESAKLRFLEKNTDFKSANLRFLEKNADFKSVNLRFLEETQIRRFVDWFGATNLRICVFSRKRRFADVQIGWGPQIYESANLRFLKKNADSQMCRLFGGYKSANLRFLEEMQIRRFADWFGANLRFLEVSQIRRFVDWLGLQICESAN